MNGQNRFILISNTSIITLVVYRDDVDANPYWKLYEILTFWQVDGFAFMFRKIPVIWVNENESNI